MPKKLTYKFIKSSFEKEGYTLLSKEYKNNKTKLDYICPEGHKHSVVFKGWQLGNRCPYCSRKIKKTISEINTLFTIEGYTLLTTKYYNASTYLYYICPEGHCNSIRWYNWGSGYRCPTCAGQDKPTIEHIKNSLPLKDTFYWLQSIKIIKLN